MAADRDCRALASRAHRGKRAKLARSLPPRKEVLVELHELRRRRQGLFLALQFENRVAADDLLGLDEWTIEDTEPPVDDAHLRARGERHQSAVVEHAAGL